MTSRSIRRSLVGKTLVFAAAIAAFALPNAAQAARTPQDLVRIQLLRLHGRLAAEALESPEVQDARAAAGRSYAALYQIRENILLEVRKREEYVDLKLALWHRQQQLAGMHNEIPVKIQKILTGASDSMQLRERISSMETDALEASPEYVAARDEFNGLVAAQQQAIADALDRVRNDPQLMALSQQLQSMRKTYRRASASDVR